MKLSEGGRNLEKSLLGDIHREIYKNSPGPEPEDQQLLRIKCVHSWAYLFSGAIFRLQR